MKPKQRPYCHCFHHACFHYKTGFYLTALFMIALTVAFVVTVSTETNRHTRLLEENSKEDYSKYSCNEILEEGLTSLEEQCRFARTCNQGQGIFLGFSFCTETSYKIWCMILGPFLLIWLILLFRMLGSTAEDYFSPSLEMFSVKLGLPPRFAGVSLLALGNGAADVSATINAITTDPQNGYLLSMGALTGAAMFIGSVVSGVVIIAADGIPCRGALVRDASALLLTSVLVYAAFASGTIGQGSITLFTSFYLSYMVIVLVADIYHRTVVIPRLNAERNAAETTRQHQASVIINEAAGDVLNDLATKSVEEEEDATRSVGNGIMPLSTPLPPRNIFSRFVTALSNYDNTNSPEEQEEGWGVESDDIINERPVRLHGAHGILAPKTQRNNDAAENEPSGGEYAMIEDGMNSICAESGLSPLNWKSAWKDYLQELRSELSDDWRDIFYDDDIPMYHKVLLVFEFPFCVMRKLTVPIPCEGYYTRAIVATSLALSPLWFSFYIWTEHKINPFLDLPIFYFHFPICLILAIAVMRFGPSGDGIMNLYMATPLALYGFFIAATWIDWVADKLVAILDLFGIVLHIPGAVMGLTILAWGNSMADLSANVAMSRKGLTNMAMTACYAGPVFNVLIGLSFGFSALSAQTGELEKKVIFSPSVQTGFIFLIINTATLIVVGVFIQKGRLPKAFGYAQLGLYVIYVMLSLIVQFL